MVPVFASVVEGQREQTAFRPLVQRIIASNNGLIYPKIMLPYRAHWGSLVNSAGELERYATSVLREAGSNSRLLVLLDADGLCPAELGPNLLQRLRTRFPQSLISVSVAEWEYESWFIASAESIADHIGAAVDFEVPAKIEEIPSAKEWLERHIIRGRYKETQHQAAFSSVIDVPLARRRSQSFDRFCREVDRLLSV